MCKSKIAATVSLRWCHRMSPPLRVISQALNEMSVALTQHNTMQRESARFKLRLALNVGPVVRGNVGVSGEAIIVTARLGGRTRLQERPHKELR